MRIFRSFLFHANKYRSISNPWLLLIWPALFVRYLLLENLNPAAQYYAVYCPLDDLIPFREEFLIPYVFWYLFIVGMHIFTLVYDRKAFIVYSRFLIIALSISTVVFLLFPTCQNLRPDSFPRDNFLTNAVKFLYFMDTNTNVCPSEHVICAIAVMITAWHCQALRKPAWIFFFTVTAIIICLSTVFLKQHSILDAFAALPVCFIAYLFSFRKFNTES